MKPYADVCLIPATNKGEQIALRIVKLLLISLFSLCLFTGSVSLAADKKTSKELVFITADHCPFCRAWERDVGLIYDNTPYAQQAPLRRVDFVDVEFVLPELSDDVVATPTFLILEDDNEIGRIEGYQSSEMFFWALSEYISP